MRTQTVTNAVQLATGYYHGCVRTAAGQTWCRGYNRMGQVGDGSIGIRSMPYCAANDSGFVELAAGLYHSCACKADGNVWCWGYNNYGEAGDGTTSNRSTPRQMLDIRDAIDAVPGNNKTCVLRADRSMWCVGHNHLGQLGDGTRVDRSRPTRVFGLGSALHGERSRLGDHMMVTTMDNATYSWGSNRYGNPLGNTTSYLTPQRINGFRRSNHCVRFMSSIERPEVIPSPPVNLS